MLNSEGAATLQMSANKGIAMKQVFPLQTDTTLDSIRSAINAAPSTTSAPFSDELIALGDDLSKRLFSLTNVTEIPDVVSLAFFLRSASLQKLKQEWMSSIPRNCSAMPRGRVFHIAPANVEVMFVYSWVVSMLCGNANIVRIPSKPSMVIDVLCQALRESLGSFPEVARSQYGISYEANNTITQALSNIAHVRVIWGGDSTVTSIRSVDSHAGLRDIVFPNRFSWAAMKASHILALTPDKRHDLAVRFFKDAYLFDQRACSSPQIVVFVGEENECMSAHVTFMEEVQRVVEEQTYSTDTAHNIEKLSSAAVIAAYDSQAVLDRRSPEVMSIATSYSEHIRQSMCGGGFFVVLYLRSLDDLATMTQSQDQTLSHAGFTESELSSAIKAICGRGFDRIVPCGQALQFEPIWDGMNLMNELTRTVRFIA